MDPTIEPAVDIEPIWEDFHLAVNMTSRELRDWLMTQASEEDGFRDANPPMPEPGRSVLAILGKRRRDLTDGDTIIMQEVIAQIRQRLSNRPASGAVNDRWRRDLMNLGHDPLRPPRSAEDVPDSEM